MKVIQKKVWVTVFTCCSCGHKKEMWHYGAKEKPTKSSYPSSGEWDGWDLQQEKCLSCKPNLNGG